MPHWDEEFELPVKALDDEVSFIVWKDNSLETSYQMGDPISIPVELLMANIVAGKHESFELAEPIAGFGELEVDVVFLPAMRRTESSRQQSMRTATNLAKTQHVPVAAMVSPSPPPTALQSVATNVPTALNSTASVSGMFLNVVGTMLPSALQSAATNVPSALSSAASQPRQNGGANLPSALQSNCSRVGEDDDPIDLLLDTCQTVQMDMVSVHNESQSSMDRRVLRPDGVGLLELTIVGGTNLPPNKNVYITAEVGATKQRTVSLPSHEWNKQMAFNVASLRDFVVLHAWLEDGGAEHLGEIYLPLSCGHAGVLREKLCIGGQPTNRELELAMRFMPSVDNHPSSASFSASIAAANACAPFGSRKASVASAHSISFRSDAGEAMGGGLMVANTAIPIVLAETRVIPLPSFNDGRPQSFSAPQINRPVEPYQYQSPACHMGQYDYRQAPVHVPAKPLDKMQWRDDPFHGWRSSEEKPGFKGVKDPGPKNGSCRKEHMLYAIQEDSPSKGGESEVVKEQWTNDPFYQWLPTRGDDIKRAVPEDNRFEPARLASLPSFSHAPLSRTKTADYSSPSQPSKSKNPSGSERDWKKDAFYGWLPGRGAEEDEQVELDAHRASHLAQLPSFSLACGPPSASSASGSHYSLGTTQCVNTMRANTQHTGISLGTLIVRVVKAYDLASHQSSKYGDASDPFVRLSMGSVSHRTKTCNNELNPVWNSAPFRFEVVNLGQELICEVFDEDTLKSNELMGKLTIPVEVVHALGGQSVSIREALVDAAQGELEVDISFESK
eukprot:GEMP01006132.1.p1 GENE.GEMP01006132.1~~GEMP01006132.1.p1  ORF type:complete len:787 (+),score=192.43 GEMP01006132.1:1068-3428(+)